MCGHDPQPLAAQRGTVDRHHRTAAGNCFVDMLGVFAEFKTMTACRSLDFQIEFAHQGAPPRFLQRSDDERHQGFAP
jgi:hypothetical protein